MRPCLIVAKTGQIAGAERIVLSLARDLKKHYQVHLALTSLSANGPLTKNIHTVSFWQIFFGRYTVVHTHLFLPGLAVALRRSFDQSFKWVHTLHYCHYETQKFGRLKSWLDHRFVFKRADALVAVSSVVYDSIQNLPNAHLIENAIALREISRVHVSANLVLGATAMLRSEKGLDDLLLAMPAVLRAYPNAKLRIAGSGPELKKLCDLAISLGIAKHVEFLGYVDDMESFYRSLDIFVSSSHSESFGMALLEAMQFGLPIVAADVGAIPAVLGSGKFGYLVPRGSDFVHALSVAILKVRGETEIWIDRAKAGLAFHQSVQNPTEMCAQYLGLFADLTRAGVCMISPIVTQATGGLQRQLLLQSRELHQRGYRVFILQRQDPRIAERAAEWSHVRFLWTPDIFPNAFKDASWALRLRGIVFVVAGFFQIARHRHQIQIIHAHQLFSPTLIGALAKKIFAIALVVKVTASGALGERNELKKLPLRGLRKLAFRQIDKLIVLTAEMSDEMREMGFASDQIELISNSVDLPEVSRETGSFQLSDQGLQILYCGRLSAEKALHNLIEASAILAQRGFKNTVHLVGGTYGGRDTTAELKTLASKTPHGAHVHFYGSRSEVAQYYLTADAFVLPSVSEGMSNSLLEALSYGVPCVASDIEANRFVITDQVNGLLFRQGDSADLANKLEILAVDRKNSGELSSRLSRASRRLVSERFSTRFVGAELERLYENIL